jgi:hypothetical protein
MNQKVVHRSGGFLTYGSVELCLYQSYHAGEAIRIHRNLFLEVVDRVEKADGIVVLGLLPREGHKRPACQCVLFTHYYKQEHVDMVDHAVTVARLTFPTEATRLATERAFMMDLVSRSVTASLAYSPSVRYL